MANGRRSETKKCPFLGQKNLRSRRRAETSINFLLLSSNFYMSSSKIIILISAPPLSGEKILQIDSKMCAKEILHLNKFIFCVYNNAQFFAIFIRNRPIKIKDKSVSIENNHGFSKILPVVTRDLWDRGHFRLFHVCRALSA